jgi:hypothetical protein
VRWGKYTIMAAGTEMIFAETSPDALVEISLVTVK